MSRFLQSSNLEPENVERKIITKQPVVMFYTRYDSKYLVQYDPVCISNLFHCLIYNPPGFHFIQMLQGMLAINHSDHTIKFHILRSQFIRTECLDNRTRLCKTWTMNLTLSDMQISTSLGLVLFAAMFWDLVQIQLI
jgi:hypothetical protein